MSNYMAIQRTAGIPSQYREMGNRVTCKACDAEFSIIHFVAMVDEALVQLHTESLEEILSGEHVDEKFLNHLYSYELD
jgi:hypothetical protein